MKYHMNGEWVTDNPAEHKRLTGRQRTVGGRECEMLGCKCDRFNAGFTFMTDEAVELKWQGQKGANACQQYNMTELEVMK